MLNHVFISLHAIKLIDFSDTILLGSHCEQRNHTLFGVWSSLRRKGQAPFSKKVLGNKMRNIASSRGNKNCDPNTLDRIIDADNDADYLYNSMQHAVSEGMNHITQTLINTGAYDDGAETIINPNNHCKIDAIGDLVNSTGELQTRGQEHIPLRPLVVTNNNG